MKPLKTILAPVDFSDVTAKVVEFAASLAAHLRCRVILVHVSEPEPQFVGYDPDPINVGMTVNANLEVTRERLEGLREKFAGVEVLVIHELGNTVEKLLSLAREHDADMIVMGSHGHGALYHLLAGSVTTAVLKEAPCPVLVIPYGCKNPE